MNILVLLSTRSSSLKISWYRLDLREVAIEQSPAQDTIIWNPRQVFLDAS